RSARGPFRVPLPRPRRTAGSRRLLPQLLVLACERAGPRRPSRRGGRADGRARRARKRRRPLLRGNRSAHRRIPRQLSPGARAPVAHRRRGRHPRGVGVRVIWSSLAGGFLGTLVLSTILRAASELGVTRMDLPFLLGTTVTDNRRRAKVYGYMI